MIQVFAFLLALHAALFVVFFLWNIRQMKAIDYLGAARFFVGLGAVAIVTFWMVNRAERDAAKHQLPATELESTHKQQIPTGPRTPRPNRWLAPATTPSQQEPHRWLSPIESRKRSSPPADQWWEEP